MNLFAYVGNNPLNFIDPLGLCGEKPGFWDGFGDQLKDAWKAWVDEGFWKDPFFVLPYGVGKYFKFRGPEVGRWKWRGEWFEGRHFHLGRGPGMQDHHLPQQWQNWLKNWWSNFRKSFRKGRD